MGLGGDLLFIHCLKEATSLFDTTLLKLAVSHKHKDWTAGELGFCAHSLS